MRLLSSALFGLFFASALEAQTITLTAPQASEDEADTLSSASLTQALTQEDASTPQDYVAAARAEYARLTGALYAMGYFSSVISVQVDGREAASLSPFSAPAQINEIRLNIEMGPRFTFGRAALGPLPSGAQLPEPFASGETATTGAVRTAAEGAIEAWRDAGHAKAATAGQSVTARHTAQELDVEIVIDPGPRLRFGALAVEGNNRVRADRIFAIAGLPVGEVYSPQELALAATRLRRTGAFRSVAMIEAEDIGANDSLPITAQVNEQKRRRLGFGAEISTLEGLTLSTYWMHRNLHGGAENLRIDGEISGIGGTTGGEDYSIALSYRRPAHFGTDHDLYILGEIEELDEPSYFSRQVSLETGVSNIVSEQFSYEYGIGYLAAETDDGFGQRTYQLLTFPASLTWDTRNDPFSASEGSYVHGDLTGFINIDGSANGLRLALDGRHFLRPGATDRLVLAFRGQFGTVIGPTIQESPSDFLFYSGGGGTVRGQSYQTLGVTTGGVTSGGRSYVGGSAEARWAYSDSIGIVGFYDVGYIGEESLPDGSGDWHAGAGIGLRYNTGFGPIRLDLAAPTTGGSVQVYVGIGQAF